MHLLIPFAAPLSEAGRTSLQGLELPALEALLAELSPTLRHEGDEYQLSPPHERALGAALGWQGADGALPWAAQSAIADGLDPGDAPWGLLSPVHWQVGREHLTMGDPQALGLTADESRAFLDALRPLFESEGWRCVWGAPTRWYVAHDSLSGLPTAALDRVIGRNPDLWMPDHPAARRLKRLQSETQMLLHTHALNEAREAAGREPLNSFWLSGCGVRQPLQAAMPRQLDSLRAPALREDWAGWAAAWQQLDAGPLRQALDAPREELTLTLCGECHAQRFERRPRGWIAALGARWRRPRATSVVSELS
jgi:hypothetical protein